MRYVLFFSACCLAFEGSSINHLLGSHFGIQEPGLANTEDLSQGEYSDVHRATFDGDLDDSIELGSLFTRSPANLTATRADLASGFRDFATTLYAESAAASSKSSAPANTSVNSIDRDLGTQLHRRGQERSRSSRPQRGRPGNTETGSSPQASRQQIPGAHVEHSGNARHGSSHQEGVETVPTSRDQAQEVGTTAPATPRSPGPTAGYRRGRVRQSFANQSSGWTAQDAVPVAAASQSRVVRSSSAHLDSHRRYSPDRGRSPARSRTDSMGSRKSSSSGSELQFDMSPERGMQSPQQGPQTPEKDSTRHGGKSATSSRSSSPRSSASSRSTSRGRSPPVLDSPSASQHQSDGYAATTDKTVTQKPRGRSPTRKTRSRIAGVRSQSPGNTAKVAQKKRSQTQPPRGSPMSRPGWKHGVIPPSESNLAMRNAEGWVGDAANEHRRIMIHEGHPNPIKFDSIQHHATTNAAGGGDDNHRPEAPGTVVLGSAKGDLARVRITTRHGGRGAYSLYKEGESPRSVPIHTVGPNQNIHKQTVTSAKGMQHVNVIGYVEGPGDVFVDSVNVV